MKVALVFLAMIAVLFMGAGIAGVAMELAARVAEGREFKLLLTAVASALFGFILFVICAFFLVKMEKRQGQEVPEDE